MININDKKRNALNGKVLTAAVACALFMSSGQATAASVSMPNAMTAEVMSETYSTLPQQADKVVITVVDANGEPVTGASVVEPGTTNGGITDIDGKVSIKAVVGKTYRVSYVGYKTVDVKVNGKNQRIVLTEDMGDLDEVVVVGYGAQKKVDLTGAVANVNVKEAIASRPITDVAKALQGITPGLTITNNLGGVGTESTIKLRGSVGSLNAEGGTAPLILVDNVEVPSLNLVNPDDIETISVLKDAASASIYGTRAAWGVILITTKQGKKNEKPRVTYSNNFAWGTPTKMPKLASAVDNAEYIYKLAQSKGLSACTNIGFTIDEYAVGKIKEWEQKYGNMSQSELGEMQEGRDFEIKNGKTYFFRSFDPVNEFTRKWTPQQNHNLSVTGGSEKTTYNISLGYLRQNGVMNFKADKYDRYNFNSNITTAIRDWWKVRANVLFTRSVNDQPYKYTSGQYDAWFYLMRWPRWYPYAQYQGKDFRSAVTDIKQANRESVTSNYVRVNLGTELNPLKNLSINFDYTFALLNDAQKRNGGTVMAYNMFAGAPFDNYTNIYGGVDNRVVQTSKYTMTNVWKAYATYNFDIKKNHQFKVMAGFDAETRERLGHYSERRGLISQDLPEIALATGDQYSFNKNYAYHKDFASAGFFGRINYDFMQKYLFEFNARYDGSSMFPSGKKFAFFPSFSAGWRASEEKFMDWAKPALSNLKLRGSWGTIGNQDVAANSFISTMTSTNSGWVMSGKNQLSLEAPTVISDGLTWERVSTLDLGVDMRFFKNELGVTFDYYHRVTSDMHTAGEALPSTFGATTPKINFGELTANGWELAVDYNHRFANGLGISARASVSHVVERITKWNKADRNINGNYEGKRLGEIWGYESDRLFQVDDFNVTTDANGKKVYTLKDGIPSQALYEGKGFKFQPGDMKYKDLDGDKKITYGKNTVEDHGDQKVIGNYLPNYEYSFTLGANWKGIDFSAYFQGVGKRDFWATGSVAIPCGGSGWGDSMFDHQMDYWTETNTDAFYPRPFDNTWTTAGKSFLKQTRYLSNMAYLRCKNITVGYTLPKAWVSKASLESVRVYFSGENLFEFDDMHLPVDPESTNYKTGYGNSSWSFGRSYPFSRTISFGMQVTF